MELALLQASVARGDFAACRGMLAGSCTKKMAPAAGFEPIALASTLVFANGFANGFVVLGRL